MLHLTSFTIRPSWALMVLCDELGGWVEPSPYPGGLSKCISSQCFDFKVTHLSTLAEKDRFLLSGFSLIAKQYWRPVESCTRHS